MGEGGRVCEICQHNSRFYCRLPFRNLFQADFFCCDACGSLFLSPLPEENILRVAYAAEYYGEDKERKFHPLIERMIDAFRMKRARELFSYLSKDDLVLDIGCGNGHFLASIRDCGARIEGVELPGAAAERAKKRDGLLLHEGDFLDLHLSPASYHAVTMWHVFEHLPHPKEVVQRVSELLPDGGIFAVSFPNPCSLQSRLFGPSWFHLDPPRHLFLPGAQGFERYLKQSGFCLLNVRHFSLEQNVFGVLQSMLNICGCERDAFYEMLKGRALQDIGLRRSEAGVQFGLAMLLLPISIFWAVFEAILKRGGTVEYIFRKES